MKKRIISLILVLALCLSLLPLAAVAADGEPADEVLAQPADGVPADDAPQQPTDALRDTGSTGEGTHADHYYCGGATCAHNDPRFENAQPIDTAEALLNAAAGSYYLTADTFLPSTWTPKDGTVLCLNNKVLALRNAIGAVIHVAQNSTFTLLDCGAGKITHSGSAGGQGVLADGTFYMYGGTITQNWGDDSRNDYAGGVYVSGTGSFHMLGGKITRNNFTDSRPNDPHISGVLVATGGTITLSRDADISDNGTMDDIYLCNDVKIAIGEGGLTGSNRSYIRLQYAPAYRSGETVEITYPTGTDVSGHFRGGGPGCIINERPSDHVVLVTAGQDWGLKVTMTPKTLTLAQGTSGTLTAKPDCNTAHDRAYQWFQNTQDSIYGGGTAITTATTNKGWDFTVPDTLTPGTYYYYCTVSLYNSDGGIVQQENAKAVVIVKKTALTVTQKSWDYGDAPLRPTVTGLPEGVTLEQATVTYSVKDANNYNTTVPTNRGTYTVKVEYTDPTDSLTYSGTCDFLIFSKKLTDKDLTLEYPRLTYNGTKQDIRHHLAVKLGNKTLVDQTDYAFVGEAVSVNANPKAAKAWIDLKGNYSGKVVFYWYIDPLEVELELVNAENRKYGDGKGNVGLRVSNAIGQDTVNVTCTGGDVLTVGSDRTVTAVALDNTNYKLPDDTAKRTFTYDVFQGDAPATQNLTMYVYNDAAQTYSFDFSKALPELADGLTFGSTIQYSTKTIYPETDWFDSGAFDLDENSGLLTVKTERANRAADTTVCVYTIFVGSTNYETFEMTLTIKTKDKAQVTVPESDITMDGWTYGQTQTTPSVAGLPAGVTPTFTYQDETGTDITPTYTTDAGAYTVTVRAETDDIVYIGTKPFTVAPKVLTADDIREYGPISPNKVYDGNTGFDLTGLGTKKTSLVGTPGANDVLYIGGTAAFAGANAGNTELIFTTNGKLGTFTGSTLKPGNYTIAKGLTKPFAARIDQRPIDFTVDSVSKRFGSPDSTADVCVTFTGVSGNSRSGLVDGEQLTQGVDYDVTATFSQATIGEDKNVVVTVTLKNTAKARNYALLNGSTNATGTITKAAAPNVPEQIVEIYSNAVTQYPIDLTKGWPAGKPSISDYTYDGRHDPELNAEELLDLLYHNASYMLPAPDDWAGTMYLSVPQAFTADVGTDLGVLKLTFKSPNYDDLTLRIRFKIKAKAQQTLNVDLEGWTYGEPANPPAYTVPAGATETTLTYTSRDGQTSYGATPPTDAGDYTLTVRCEGIDTIWTGTADFTIAKKQITPPAADTTKFAYTALEQTYQLAANAAYTVSPNTTQTDAGDYTVTVSLNDTANTEWTDGTTAAKPYTFTIARAALTVTALDREMIAGEDAPDLNSPVEGKDYTVEGLLGADVLTNVTLSYNETPDTSRAGTYTINIAATLKNYGIATVPGTLTIKPAPPKRQPMGITAPGRVPGGTIEIDPKNATPGQTVTITVKPDKGYEIGDVTVKDIDGEKIDVKRTGDNEFTFVMPKSSVSIKANFVREGEEFFRDVPANAYYYDAVRWAKQNGITGGIGDNLFGSTLPCTRAQIVTFLWRAAGSPEPKSAANFTDVPASAYYAKAVAWAVEEGITNGVGDNKFDPDAPCTRAQCVAFLYRAAGSPKVTGAADFTDVAETAYYAKAVAWAQKQDITDGVSATRFAPQKDCTRAQIVTFLYRAFAE